MGKDAVPVTQVTPGMGFVARLLRAQQARDSLLCVGLDPQAERLPMGWQGKRERIFDFCAAVVEATHEQACAFKPQIAYFAAHGAEVQLERLVAHIRQVAPDVPVILDAKRGDIGSTAQQYAIEAFERYGADAVTLSPYMGGDTIEPFTDYPDRGIFLLCRTSNPGGADLQDLRLADVPGQPRLYEHVASQAQHAWNRNGQLGLVVGATYPQDIVRVRERAPHLPLLIPGVGAQGGDIDATVAAGLRRDADGTITGTIVVNSSRAILYASAQADFAQAAAGVAEQTRLALQAAAKRLP